MYVIDNSGVLLAARLLPEYINKQEKAQRFLSFLFQCSLAFLSSNTYLRRIVDVTFMLEAARCFNRRILKQWNRIKIRVKSIYFPIRRL